MHVKDAMSTSIVVIDKSQTLYEAARLMIERRVGALIILDETLPGPGILTERDVMRAVAEGNDPSSTKVEEVMTFEARTSGLDWDLPKAGQAMVDGHFRHLLVVDDAGGVIGMVSMRDIVRAHVEHDRPALVARA